MSPSISDAAVRKATGREWDEWFAILADAERSQGSGSPLGHKALVAYLRSEDPDLSGWWRQMVVVEYEKHAGRRVTGETADTGFQLGAQKTMAASSDDVWAALTAPDGLAAWLGDDVGLTLEEGADYGADDGPSGQVRVVVPGDRVRLTWQPGTWPRPSTLQVRVRAKGSDRTTVGFHHEHLPDEAARDAMRAHWKTALAALAERVES